MTIRQTMRRAALAFVREVAAGCEAALGAQDNELGAQACRYASEALGAAHCAESNAADAVADAERVRLTVATWLRAGIAATTAAYTGGGDLEAWVINAPTVADAREMLARLEADGERGRVAT